MHLVTSNSQYVQIAADFVIYNEREKIDSIAINNRSPLISGK